jgi:hypothetical protein
MQHERTGYYRILLSARAVNLCVCMMLTVNRDYKRKEGKTPKRYTCVSKRSEI